MTEFKPDHEPYPKRVIRQRTFDEQAAELLKSYGLHETFKKHIASHGGVKNDYDKALLLLHPEMLASAENRLVISLLPPSKEGEFILERNVTAITKHPDKVLVNDNGLQAPPDALFVRIPNSLSTQNGLKAIIHAIDTHYKIHGRINVLEIVGHGTTNMMAIGENSPASTVLNNKDILKALIHYQQTNHVQVADTILMGGCGIMANLSKQDAQDYNDLAKKLHASVKGSTVTVFADRYDEKGVSGLFVVFDGSKTIGVDTALSHLNYYIKTRPKLGADSVMLESKEQIKAQSQWLNDYNAKHGNKDGSTVDVIGFINTQDTVAVSKAKPGTHQK